MTNPTWYKSDLPDILFPQGNKTSGPTVIPDVLDSDGNPVFFTDTRRFVSQATSVDVGDSPNSNTGDPLRTAFVKIDNIVEALYRNDAGKAYRLAQMETPGRFMGMLSYAQLATTFAPPRANVVDPTVQPNQHNFPQNGDWCILREFVFATPSVWDSEYRYISRNANTAIQYSTFQNPQIVSVNAYSVLRWNTSLRTSVVDAINGVWAGQWEVIQQRTIDDIGFNIDAGLARLATGTADWYTNTSDSENAALQQALYRSFQDQGAITKDSKRLRARNFEDAVTEMIARATINTQDAGYYG